MEQHKTASRSKIPLVATGAGGLGRLRWAGVPIQGAVLSGTAGSRYVQALGLVLILAPTLVSGRAVGRLLGVSG